MSESGDTSTQEQRPIPPPILFGLATTIGWIFDRKALRRSRPPQGATTAVAAGVRVAGGALGAWTIITMKRSGQSPDPKKAKTSLIKTGPFKYTRNPIYVSAALSSISTSLRFGSPTGIILVLFTWIFVDRTTVKAEEEYLRHRFHKEYDAYCDTTPRWLGVKSFR